MKAVILAGGKGTRLFPLTLVFPKSMLPIKGKPVLEILIKHLSSCGINEVILSVGYLSEIIQAYFNGRNHVPKNLKLSYFKENKPLGTIGSLSLIKNLDQTFLVVNSDILSDLEFKKLIRFHKAKRNLLTIAACKRETKISYGVIQVNKNNELTGIEEKPNLDYLINMGAYVFEPKALGFLRKNKKFDFPDLAKILLKKGEKVGVYLSNSYWIDIGKYDDLKEANASFGNNRTYEREKP